MNDLRVELRARNNVLWHAIFDTHKNVAAFCRQHHVGQSEVGALLNLKRSPFDRNGELLPLSRRLCDITGIGADELFPAYLYAHGPIQGAAEVSGAKFLPLVSAKRLALPAVQEDNVIDDERREAIVKLLKTLTPREASVVSMRYGLADGVAHNEREIARHFDVTPQRINQLTVRALEKLRHPSRIKHLKPHLPHLIWNKEDERWEREP